MRRALVMTIALGALGAGCTFLITFDDAPATDAGGVIDSGVAAAKPDTSSTSSDVDTGATPPDDSGGPIPVRCDPTFPLAKVTGCNGIVDNGFICADNARFTNYPGTKATDLVICDKDKAKCVMHCVSVCGKMPEGFPDQCDDCSGKADGTYCGSEMTDWPAQNAKLLVKCLNGRFVIPTTVCPKTCTVQPNGSSICAP